MRFDVVSAEMPVDRYGVEVKLVHEGTPLTLWIDGWRYIGQTGSCVEERIIALTAASLAECRDVVPDGTPVHVRGLGWFCAA
jgi:hypothetical protein